MAKKKVLKKTVKKSAPVKAAKKASPPKTKVKKVAAVAVKKPVKKVVAKPKQEVKASPKIKASPKVTATGGSMLNKKCPDFTLANSENIPVSLASLKGKKVVLYFYPKDSTPGCTLEGQQFARMHKDFQKENTVILGVSKDSVESHDKFKCKFNFPFELLADVDGKLCEAFDVIQEKNMYGKKYMGIERSTFIIDEDQKIIGEFRKISLAGHAELILDQIKAVSKN